MRGTSLCVLFLYIAEFYRLVRLSYDSLQEISNIITLSKSTMNLSSLRSMSQVGVRCNRVAISYPLCFNSSANFVYRQKIGAAYSSLSRQSSEGRTVIVTGSSRGIGKAIALRLAADGYSVCVNDLSANKAECDEVVEEIRSMGRKACIALADVTKRDQVKNMIQTSVRELGPLNTM